MTDERGTHPPQPSTDAVTTGSITGTGTGGLGSAGGTDTTPDVSSTPVVLDRPEPTGSPRDEAVERAGEATG
jgi:hypothetical protein